MTTKYQDNGEQGNVEWVFTVRAYLHDSSAATLSFLRRRVGAAIVVEVGNLEGRCGACTRRQQQQ